MTKTNDKVDVDAQVDAVRRQVGRRTIEAGEARVLTMSQVYDATVDDVWDACTNPERLPRWFAPVSGDLRLGGHYQVEGNASGTIERCDPPTAFAATWEYGGEVSWIEVRLTAEPDDRTRFELEHVARVDDERWSEFGPGAVGIGWDLSFLGLGLHLTSRQDITADHGMEWMGSDEGRRFVVLSGRRWGDADVAGGAEESEARAAQERTIAAYTAPPPDAPTES